MELVPTMLVSLVPTILVCLVTAWLVIRQGWQKRNRKLPPGPRGLPLIGHLHLVGKLPHQSFCELSKVHGPLMWLWMGSVPCVVASSPEMARQILQTHDHNFAHRMPTAVANIIFAGCTDIGFSPPNAHWKLIRQLLATEIVGTKGIQFFKPVREEEKKSLMRSILAESSSYMHAANDQDLPALQQIRPKLQRAANNIVSRMLLGKRFSEIGPQDSLIELIAQTLKLLGESNMGDFFPWLAWMDLQGSERRSRRMASQLKEVFEGIILARRRSNAKHACPPTNDFLDVLLQASDSSHTPIHIMEVLIDLFVASTDTITAQIEWVLAMLLSNPEKMRIVQVEIDKVVGRERVVEEEDINHLPFLVACVKETMRLHPTGPLLIPHKSSQPCDLLGFHIPKNTQTFVNTWAIGRDPKIWENPTNFFPERFLEVDSVDIQGQHFEILPFGSGRRICPGWRLGLLTVNMILASLLQGFEWSIPPSHHVDTSEYFDLSLRLATPLVACTTPRLPRDFY